MEVKTFINCLTYQFWNVGFLHFRRVFFIIRSKKFFHLNKRSKILMQTAWKTGMFLHKIPVYFLYQQCSITEIKATETNNNCKENDLLLSPVPFFLSNILFSSSLFFFCCSSLIFFFPCFLHGFKFILYITFSKFGHIGLLHRFRWRKQNLSEDVEKAKIRKGW